MPHKQKVLLGMSGGVDSSVAAYLLKGQGYEVLGIFMHFWAEGPGKESDATNKCCSVASFNDARRVAQKLEIPLYTVNFDMPFKELVVDRFISGYQEGETPNPCVSCNKYIKFSLLWEKADALGAEYIATGHYSRIKEKDGIFHLQRPKDKNKDQTYFLYNLNQKLLKHTLFPLADLTKPQVRALAKKIDLSTAEKPESQEICFIPEKNHNEFLKRHLRLTPGPIKTTDGLIVGEHQGLPLYTVGQRKGVEIGGVGPFYVARCDYDSNTLIVVRDGDDPHLFTKQFTVREMNWIGPVRKYPINAQAVIRYRHQPINCSIDEPVNGISSVKLEKSQRAITAGQSAVFYKGNEVLGGGIIC